MLAAQRDSIRLLRIVLGAAVVVPTLVVAFTGWSAYRAANSVADRQIERSLSAASEHALKVFETIDVSISLMEEIVQDLPAGDAHESRLHDRLKGIVERHPQIKSAWVFGADGYAVANSLVNPSPRVNFSDRDYFSIHIPGDRGVYVGELLQPRPPYGGEPFFSISRRRTNARGEFAGVIQISALPEYFNQFYSRLGRDDDVYYSLVRSDGAVLARHPRLDTPVRIANTGVLGNALREQPDQGLVTARSPVDGAERRLGYAKLPGYPVLVLAGVDTSTIRWAWMKWLAGLLAFVLPATLALLAVVGVALRRTQRLYAEAARRELAESALRQAQRLEGLGQLTGGVAHDFNNLLMVIGGAAQQLKKHVEGERAQRAVMMIDTASKRAAALTQKLLSFARRRTLSPKVVDIGAYLVEFEDVLARTLRADIDVRFEGLTSGLCAEIDPDELEIALLNLAANARDAMPDGGSLRLAVTGPSFAPGHGPDGIEGDFVAITMTDTGTGMADEIKGRIFEPFFTTKAPDRGTGLGLSQVYGFAKQSRGTLTVQSAPGKGSVFVLYLPRTRKAPETAQPSEGRATRTAAAGEPVLLVEDNREVADIAAGYLEELGYIVSHAGNVDDALRVLREKRVNLVLTDIVMPGGLSGLDLARTVKAHHGRLPVVLATGYSDRATAAREEGFVLLTKPYTLDNLARAIQDAQRTAA